MSRFPIMLGMTIPPWGGIGVVNRKREVYPPPPVQCAYDQDGLTAITVEFDGITGILYRDIFWKNCGLALPSNVFDPAGCGFTSDHSTTSCVPFPAFSAFASTQINTNLFNHPDCCITLFIADTTTQVATYYDDSYYYVYVANRLSGVGTTNAIYRLARTGLPSDYFGTYNVIGTPGGYVPDPAGDSYATQSERHCCATIVGTGVDRRCQPCTSISTGLNFNYPLTVTVS